MKIFKDFIRWFLYITVGVLIVCAVNFQLSDVEALPRETLWQILLSGGLTAGVTVFLYPKENADKVPFWIRVLIHYAALCIVMILCGHSFGWLEYKPEGIVMMLLSVAGVYALAFGIYYMIDLKRADEINQKLKEKYGDQEGER